MLRSLEDVQQIVENFRSLHVEYADELSMFSQSVDALRVKLTAGLASVAGIELSLRRFY
jgi:hypothetical protein